MRTIWLVSRDNKIVGTLKVKIGTVTTTFQGKVYRQEGDADRSGIFRADA